MKRYLAYAKQSFLANSAFRFDTLLGILDTCLRVFIFWCIYRALYGGAESVDGISFAMVNTNFILSVGLSAAFTLDEYYLPYRINNGSIGTELLKPVSFKGALLFFDLGNIGFKLLFQFLPALVLVIFTAGMLKPASFVAVLCFFGSVVLGFLVLWLLNFIVQTLGFWIINVWSISTIKNVFVNVLSGAMLPLWFMPEWMQGVLYWTPFSSIYFTPVQIYLGEIAGAEILLSFLRQGCWIVILYALAEVLWRCGIKKLVIQGG